jgi:hypothetical protein
MELQKFKSIIGYDWTDNIFIGLFLGLLGISLAFYLQYKYYAIDSFWEYKNSFIAPLLKRSLMGGLVVFLLFNYFDKLYSARGVFIAVLLTGLYIFFG